jgi:hypothetical protein
MNMRLHSTTGKKRGCAGGLITRRGPGAGERNGESPFLVEFFMVQGIGFQCMAYLGFDGKWRTAFENIVLPGTVRVLE